MEKIRYPAARGARVPIPEGGAAETGGPVRILVLTPFLSWPLRHGGRIRSHHLLRALATGHEVINVTGLSGDDRAADVATLEALGISVKAVPLDPAFGRLGWGQRASKLGHLLRGRSSLVPRFRTPALGRAVREACRGADLCVLEQLWMASCLDDLGDLPFVLSSQNVESALQARKLAADPPGPGRWIARREVAALRRFEAAVARRARRVVAVSEEDRRAFQALAPDARVEVVENGVDLETRPRLEAPTFRPLRLLYVGGYDYAPNLEAARVLAREILPRVQAFDPAAELHLVGRDPAGQLTDLAGLPGVFVPGPVPELMPELARASALVVPLSQGGGSRLKIVEAWAVGRPVVSSPTGAEGLGETDELPLLLAEGPDRFATALRTLQEDATRGADLIERGRARAESRHDWRRLGERFRRLVEEAGKEGRLSP